MAASLPLELITEIFTKLPVKSLHRFKCVSKTWNSMITSSNFIKQHLRQTLISNTNNKIIISNNNSLLSSAISDVKIRFDTVNHPLNNLPHRPAIDIIDSVQRSGLCRESSVYSMRNDSWVSVYDETVSYTLLRINAVAVDEILYFVVFSNSRDYKPVLKCFDLRTSTFSLVDYPELDSYDFDKMTMSLRNLRGCLCLLMNYHNHKVDPAKAMGYPLYNHHFLYADVWELNESKWVKLFRIRKNEIHKHCLYLRLVTYSKDENSVLIEVDGIWFGWYDLVSKRIERVSVQGLRVEDSPYLASIYVESLVSVVNNKLVSKKEGTRPKKTIEKNDFLSSGFKLNF